MKLYFSPGACSMAVHIALREAGLPFDLEQVDLAAKRTVGGADYLAVNPKGYVPALQLDDGQVLTEAAVVLQYVADRQPAAGLAPPLGSMERYRLMEWLNFVSSELHKPFGALFNPAITAESKEMQLKQLARRFDYLSQALADQAYLMGETYTVADCYLFTVLGWSGYLDIDLAPWPRLKEYLARLEQRPAVQATTRAEGLSG